MKTLLSLIALAMVAVLAGCASEPTYVIVPVTEKRTTPRAPVKYVGGSSTYSTSSPESFRAVGPSN